MKVKGKMDPNILDKLGIGSPEKQMRQSVRSQSPPQEDGHKAVRGNFRNSAQGHRTDSDSGSGAPTRFPRSNPHDRGFKSQMAISGVNKRSAPKFAKSVKASSSNPIAKGLNFNAQKAKRDMDALRKKFNDELLQVLEEEQQKENEREAKIQSISNP